MITTPLLSLFLLLPTLALGGHNDRMDIRSHARQRNHARAAALQESESHLLRREFHDAVEHKMARKLARAGMEFAKRKADGSQCRPRNATTPTTLSRSVTSTATSTVISSSSTSTDAATTTSSTDQQQQQQQTTASSTEQQATSTSSADNSAATGQALVSNPTSYSGHTPNGNKAGVSAGDSLGWLSGKLGWWYDWSATPSGSCGNAVAVPMIWGGGTADGDDASRLAAFKSMDYVPQYIIGFEEPDCAAGSGSAGMDVGTAISIWNQYVVPKGEAGSILVGPSMCKQAAESGWLGPFMDGVTRKPDIMNIHVNKNSAAGIYADIDHYYNTYGLPIWVTEFACVDDSTSFIPCTDQSEIDSFIHTAVDIFESDSRIAGYAYSNGYGLGDVWPMVSNGQLTASGQTYLNALSKYH
ncbi:uncharacterized protein I303_104378 [Kwoniella dejecticola CBS 10117]|uniref:Asl1-like glycosyl hydrolase catalytic domain-containing protein n=1 Tax=Kwoniella dejecticola CBS 10117 TaxID=1296121 RepID=A0A1A6A5I3_9TREE|nr:uncharacterized protein I303_04645 [Kwoniella dejecticola CBS 10117]OBR85310.1 hypothetical protein I303_04645 [Kwoniella dejecticola CBS 10117]